VDVQLRDEEELNASVTLALVANYVSVKGMSSQVEAEVEDGKLAFESGAGFLAWVSALVHVHRERLLAYARRRGLGAEDALDAVQDSFVSFLRLPEARGIAHDGDDALKLLTVIVRHNLQNHLSKDRRHGRARALLEAEAAQLDDESSESIIARAEEVARVKGCIARLGQLQRQVVMLSLLDEQPRDRVADLLGISAGYVRVLLHRAREHVRNCPYDSE
jgi:RNA polymerase sigma-70 factor (ECF subfamily)